MAALWQEILLIACLGVLDMSLNLPVMQDMVVLRIVLLFIFLERGRLANQYLVLHSRLFFLPETIFIPPLSRSI